MTMSLKAGDMDAGRAAPRDSRIGAWASLQSRPLKGRFELEKRVAEFGIKYAVGKVPRPPCWSGFRLRPGLIEFWKDGAFRLHDRLQLALVAISGVELLHVVGRAVDVER